MAFTNSAFSAALLALVAYSAAAQDAQFTVTDDVAVPAPDAFTATIAEVGNGSRLLSHGGFEPIVYRTMFLATQDADNTIIASDSTLSNWNSWTNGTFDGAEVEILRIEDGRFVSVRTDRVPEGGFHASGWTALNKGKAVPAGTTSFLSGWDTFNRSGVPYYYTVRAVDRRGNLSPPAPAVSVTGPDTPGKTPDAPTLDLELTEGPAAALAAPAGLQGTLADGVARLEWQPVEGAAGYVVYRAERPEAEHGHSVTLEGQGPAIRAGDMVMLRKRITEFDRASLVSNRIWGAEQARRDFLHDVIRDFPDADGATRWRLEPHTPDTPVTDAGETFLRADLMPNRVFSLGPYNYAGTDQTWYDVLDPAKTYRFEVWMRASGDADAGFTLEGPYGRTIAALPAQFDLTSEWQKFTAEFTVPELLTAKDPGRMTLAIKGQGQIDIDNFRIYATDAPYLAFSPEDAAALRASGMGMLRTHSFVKVHERTYDLTQLTAAGGLGSVAGGNTLPQTLQAIGSVDMDPWLQIQPHLSRDEWLGLAEYLAAPAGADTPMAAKRAAQGQVQPWTDRFDRIYLEIGNETWNSLFAPWVFPDMRDTNGRSYTRGEVYGLYQEYVLSILTQSPWWPELEPHVVPVLGGWAINDYGFDAARRSPRSRILSHADYIGGWDSGEGPVKPTPEGFASVLAFSPQAGSPGSADLVRKARGQDLVMGTYESGPGYALNGLNGENVTEEQAALQEQVMKSAAAGTATLDTFLANMRNGYGVQNYFTFGRGSYWKSHAPWYDGGQGYPSWAWLALTNRELLGDMLTVRAKGVPTRNLPEAARRKAARNAPMVDVYALRREGRLSVVAVSRLVPGVPAGQDGHSTLSVDLPIASAQKVTRYVMTGDYTSQNLTEDQARIVAEDVPLGDTPAHLDIDLPPGAVVVHVFDGVE